MAAGPLAGLRILECGDFVGKLAADSEWQHLSAQAGSASSPTTIVDRGLWTEVTPQG